MDKTTNENIRIYQESLMNKSLKNSIQELTKTEISNDKKKLQSIKEKEDSECDSDEMAFKKITKEEINFDYINKKAHDIDNDEELSELSKDSNLENECKDTLYAQYEKVHRVKNKWKCSFKDAVLQINGKEYVFDKVTGELERNW
jgi:transcription initiation factor TFIIA large subunit